MRYILVLTIVLLSSCSVSDRYINQVKMKYPKGNIYMIDNNKFIVFDSDKMSLYYVEYFKGGVFITDMTKVR